MLKITFVFDKETKNTIKFNEVGSDVKVGTVYIPKTTLISTGIDKDKGFTMTLEAIK